MQIRDAMQIREEKHIRALCVVCVSSVFSHVYIKPVVFCVVAYNAMESRCVSLNLNFIFTSALPDS